MVVEAAGVESRESAICQHLGAIHLARICSNDSNGWIEVQNRYSSSVSAKPFLDDLNPEVEREIFAVRNFHVRAHFVPISRSQNGRVKRHGGRQECDSAAIAVRIPCQLCEDQVIRIECQQSEMAE